MNPSATHDIGTEFSLQNFAGFARPKENWYRLPNYWFDLWRVMREQSGQTRILADLKVAEYVIKHTWGYEDFECMIRLSLREIQDGRHGKHGTRLDRGTGLHRGIISDTAQHLTTLNLLEVVTDDHDAARITKHYRVRLAQEARNVAGQIQQYSEFNGFALPQTNYFPIPDQWTDLTRPLRSETAILGVEYHLRHAWGFNQQGLTDRVIDMSVDEVCNGRYMRQNDGSFQLDKQNQPTRIDNGIGYHTNRVREGMDIAVEQGFLVSTIRHNPITRLKERVYMLRYEGWPMGEVAHAPVIRSTRYTDALGEPAIISAPRVTSKEGNTEIAPGSTNSAPGSTETKPSSTETAPGSTGIKPSSTESAPSAPQTAPRTYETTVLPTEIPIKQYKQINQQQQNDVAVDKKIWNQSTDRLICIDLLRLFGFSTKIATTLTLPWTEQFEDTALKQLVGWIRYIEQSDSIRKPGHGFLRSKLQALEDAPLDLIPKSESATNLHWAEHFVTARCLVASEFDVPLLDLQGWWQTQRATMPNNDISLTKQGGAGQVAIVEDMSQNDSAISDRQIMTLDNVTSGYLSSDIVLADEICERLAILRRQAFGRSSTLFKTFAITRVTDPVIYCCFAESVSLCQRLHFQYRWGGVLIELGRSVGRVFEFDGDAACDKSMLAEIEAYQVALRCEVLAERSARRLKSVDLADFENETLFPISLDSEDVVIKLPRCSGNDSVLLRQIVKRIASGSFGGRDLRLAER